MNFAIPIPRISLTENFKHSASYVTLLIQQKIAASAQPMEIVYFIYIRVNKTSRLSAVQSILAIVLRRFVDINSRAS